MSEKVILIGDPGIDGAFAISLALFDPKLDVLGVAATAGNVSAAQATRNVQIVVDQIDPPRLPRLGQALPIEYDVDGTHLHGPNGLGNSDFPCAPLHHLPASDKLIVDLVKQHPHEVTLINMGPGTVLARAIDLFAELPGMVKRLVLLGGCVNDAGNVGPVSEFHFFCDPTSMRQLLRASWPITMVPLDVMRKLLLAPTELLDLPEDSKPCRFLREVVPFGIASTSNMYGIEGFHLKDVLGVIAVALPDAFKTRRIGVDVEIQGELTRGMSVLDRRTMPTIEANVDLATEISVPAVRAYVDRVLTTHLTG